MWAGKQALANEGKKLGKFFKFDEMSSAAVRECTRCQPDFCLFCFFPPFFCWARGLVHDSRHSARKFHLEESFTFGCGQVWSNVWSWCTGREQSTCRRKKIFFVFRLFRFFYSFFSGGGKYMPALSHIIASIRQTFIVLNCFWQTFIIIPLYCTFILINVFFSR